jgi:hypothetical protein
VAKVRLNTLTDSEAWGGARTSRVWWPVRSGGGGDCDPRAAAATAAAAAAADEGSDGLGGGGGAMASASGGAGERLLLTVGSVGRDMPVSWVWSEVLRALEAEGRAVAEGNSSEGAAAGVAASDEGGGAMRRVLLSGVEVIGLRRDVDSRCEARATPVGTAK